MIVRKKKEKSVNIATLDSLMTSGLGVLVKDFRLHEVPVVFHKGI